MPIKLDTEKSFGENVRLALLDRGWSNAQFSRRVGISTTMIGNIIRGLSPGTKSGELNLKPEMVDKISSLLEFPPAEARLLAGCNPVDLAKIEPYLATLMYEHSDLEEKDKDELRPTLEMMLAEIRRRNATGELRRQKNPQNP